VRGSPHATRWQRADQPMHRSPQQSEHANELAAPAGSPITKVANCRAIER
jgi:hypothetical protein